MSLIPDGDDVIQWTVTLWMVLALPWDAAEACSLFSTMSLIPDGDAMIQRTATLWMVQALPWDAAEACPPPLFLIYSPYLT